ncbi:MAG: lipoyl synthase [Methylococcales bacterium]|jgi:lipoyl synthase|nr:lipoyl synthase [Methylococcales bacterium]MBT7410581.1 lipoyl synthase [Methylococcales bacterium]
MSNQTKKQTGFAKTSKIPVKIVRSETLLRKPSWIRAKAPTGKGVSEIRKILKNNHLNTVCEEASCPNLGECFSHGTATFMIMGDICTRRCPFCDVAHGRPDELDVNEPEYLASSIAQMKLRYVVITSVDRDDLKDGGASHFNACIKAVRQQNPETKIEILVPDFRGRMQIALGLLSQQPPDVFNHNLETVPRLYKAARPGADYQWSLNLIKQFKEKNSEVLTKSGIMLGLGEEMDEVEQVMQDLFDSNCEMLTIGQYLQPTIHHLPVKKYVHPDEFLQLKEMAEKIGFKNVASGPMVRSSYHADLQAKVLV